MRGLFDFWRTFFIYHLKITIMPNEWEDKKPLPGNDHAEPAPGENIIPQNPQENEEQDLDDLIHNSLRDEIPPNEEIDPDDAVHNSSNKASLPPDTEKDPDDLVHGN